MGAANCCKKPEQIVCEEIKENGEGDKMNALDQDSYPQDTEYVFNGNAYPQDDKAQQEVSNQVLYEQEGSPKIGGAYEVAINSSSPIQYDQVEVQTPEKINQEVLVQNEMNNNQYSPEELAMYQNQININAKPDSYKEEIQELNQNEKPENLENLNQNQDQEEIPIKESNGPKQIEIKQSDISNLGAVKFSSLISQRSAAPVNTISQVVQSQQVIQTPETNSKALKIQQVPQATSQIQVKEVEEGEDLNKYFQIPTNLAKAKTTIPSNIQINEVQKFIQQNQSQKGDGNVASVTPIAENDDINNVNNYFNQLSSVPQTQTDNMTDEEILNKYFSKTTSQEVKPEEIIHNNLNVQNIINMKYLPPTFGSHDINNFKQTTTTTTTKTTGNIPAALTSSEIKKIIDMKDLPETLGSNDINNFKQTTTTTTTKTTGNIDLKNIPGALTSSEIKKIIDMKDLPETLGSNDINNFKQTTTTTTTKTTGNIDLKNIPGALTSSEIKKIIDMKDLPTTFGSNDIKNFKQTTTTTTTKTTGNIPGALTASQIKSIIDMKDLPETFGSSNISKVNKTTATTTTSTTPANINLKNLPDSIGSNDIKNFKQTTTTTTTKTTGNIPGALTASQIKNIIDMKDLPETFGSSNISKANKTTVTSTTTTTPANIDLKQFGLEQNPSMGQFNSQQIDLKQFGLEPMGSQISTAGKNKQVTTVTKSVQKNVSNPTDDYSKYFQNIQTSSNNPIDLQQFGLEKNASNISNILQGSNIAFKQQGQTSVSSANYGTNNDLGITSASTPIITNDNYGKYFKTTKTTTTSLNQTRIPYSTNVNLNNYGINIPQGKTTTTTTTTKTSGIPISSSSVTQNYTLPANYAANKITSSKVTKTYVGPTQTSSYNYSYNIPTITPTTTTVKK